MARDEVARRCRTGCQLSAGRDNIVTPSTACSKRLSLTAEKLEPGP